MNWISIEDELPPNNKTVLCCDVHTYNLVTLGKYIEDDDCFELMSTEFIEIDSQPTHWMHLPEPPLDKPV